jgi:CheY-like chemotaxis protein
MTNEPEGRPAEQNTSHGVHNVSLGSATNVIQMRDLNGGNVYINSHVVVHGEPGAPVPTSSAPHALHVLVVDDDPAVVDEMLGLLRADSRIGPIGTARDAADALRYIRSETQCDRPSLDAWFLDIGIPGLSGMELAWMGTHLSPAPDTVFVTAFEEHAVAAFDLEAADYLVKPISADRVSRAIDRLCRRAPARRAPSPPRDV